MFAIHCRSLLFQSSRSIQANEPADSYLGYLFSISDYKCFGLVTNTQTKIVAVCDMATNELGYIRDAVYTVHGFYITAVMNPFQEIGTSLHSKKLRTNIQQIVQKYNNNVNYTSQRK